MINLTIFCSIDERLLKDPIIQKLLIKHSFKPTKANPRIFYARKSKGDLLNVQKDLSIFYYTNGRLVQLSCPSFQSFYLGKANHLDWLDHCKERNG